MSEDGCDSCAQRAELQFVAHAYPWRVWPMFGRRPIVLTTVALAEVVRRTFMKSYRERVPDTDG